MEAARSGSKATTSRLLAGMIVPGGNVHFVGSSSLSVRAKFERLTGEEEVLISSTQSVMEPSMMFVLLLARISLILTGLSAACVACAARVSAQRAAKRRPFV